MHYRIYSQVLHLLLKSIRNISMDMNTLDMLERSNAIPVLVPFLNSVTENQNQVLACMYDLCKIKVRSQILALDVSKECNRLGHV